MAALPPLPSPIALFPPFQTQTPQTLILREKILSLSGDDFHITLASGAPLLRVSGNVLSLSGRKKVFDEQGVHLFDIVKERWHLHATFRVEDKEGKGLVEVRSELKLVGSKATARFTSLAGRQEVLGMKGNWLDSAADIVDESSGAVVARIDRKLLSGRDLFAGQQTYAVTVAPGADMALVAALCICLDEKNNEK
ncbi:tubby C-terminal-like domain-containing protein [Boeremia exigua]|uniref:tubby C-terminal-like domain-containing protein n=1 Tax=Boeremia exigua TaxID=749465 RepID=UPI001E8DB6F9|nr:tubby C-terminal-like domain-containing protein [Boeremia exigua]KAH6633671.1 tubby C-terminal-like domain-containing protein [Boeremia exigua]